MTGADLMSYLKQRGAEDLPLYIHVNTADIDLEVDAEVREIGDLQIAIYEDSVDIYF